MVLSHVSGLARRAALLGVFGVASCGQGSVYFVALGPDDTTLSPLNDSRIESMSIVDEATGRIIGTPILPPNQGAPPTQIGTFPVGSYRLRMSISGGGQLLGLGRSGVIQIASGEERRIELPLRKPLVFFGSSLPLGPDSSVYMRPDRLMWFDSTLPPGMSTIEHGIGLGDFAGATAATHDGTTVLAAIKAKLAILPTGNFDKKREVNLQNVTKVLSIAVAPDDRSAAIVADTGVVLISDLHALLSDPAITLPAPLPLPNARVAAYTHDSASFTILTGPSWEAIDCTAPQPTSSNSSLVSGTPTVANLSVPVPTYVNSTDIAYDATGHLIVATPCATGAQYSDGGEALAGRGIFDVLVSGTRIVGVTSTAKVVRIPYDPNDPRKRDVPMPFGEIALGGDRPPVQFRLLRDRIDISPSAQDQPVAVTIEPSRVDAYDAALSPDGTHVIFASRTRYQVTNLRYFRYTSDYYCDLTTTEDLYSVTEVDTSSGQVSYSSIKAIQNTSCSNRCTACDVSGCNPAFSSNCQFNDGFVPMGVTILMGEP